MRDDPIVSEIRKARKTIMKKYGYDVKAIGQMLAELDKTYFSKTRKRFKVKLKQAA